jgi:hypothetical protein
LFVSLDGDGAFVVIYFLKSILKRATCYEQESRWTFFIFSTLSWTFLRAGLGAD